MPVEIRELVIRATVATQNSSSGATSAANSTPLSMTGDNALIQACVSQVMELLEKQKER